MIMARLRQETAVLHQDVEREVDLLSPSLTIDRYIKILRAFEAFFVPWEAALEAHCPVLFAGLWSGRARAYRLRHDLATLGADPAPSMQRTAAECMEAPDLSDVGRWLGSLYVVEGSTLGGQVISRHLEARFGCHDSRGYSFFSGYGSQTGPRWRDVCAALESSQDRGNQIIEGAHLTFGNLLRDLRTFL